MFTSILIVEDDLSFSILLQRFLTRHAYSVHTAHSVKAAKDFLLSNTPNLVLLDYRLPDGNGTEILELLQKLPSRQVKVIVMTNFNDVRTAVQSIKLGAFNYITKPINQDELLHNIQQALQHTLPTTSGQPSSNTYVEGNSPQAQLLRKHTALVAPTNFSVIIQGDSGTGKEITARTIHHLSHRASAPFIALDCGALSAELAGSELFGHVKGSFTGALQNKTGVFEAAHGGTIFLDEVGNLSYDIQVKLLRALQERTIMPIGSTNTIKVDVRIIAATNENLHLAVKDGKFREDLYHRLNEFKIEMPTLQQRIEDLPLFCKKLITLTNGELNKQVIGISPSAMSVLTKYHWPGNLRELRNIIRRAVLTTTNQYLDIPDLPPELIRIANTTPLPQQEGLKSIQNLNEKELIIKALEEAKFNKTKAAKILNIDRATLYYKLSKYNIE